MSMSAPSAAGDGNGDAGRGVIRVQGVFPHLIVKDRGGYQSRHRTTLAMLREVLTTNADLFAGRRFDFFIGSFDNPESCNALADIVPWVLAYAVTDQCRPNILPIPDFIYGGWPEAGIDNYAATCAAIAAAGGMPPRHDKIFWIGNAGMDPARQRLLDIGRLHPESMEFVGMQWRDGGVAATRLDASRYMSLPDHAAYAMLLDIRGAGYSGRLKLLMHAARPVLRVESRFREFFFDRLRPFEYYLPVKPDLSDLAEKTAELKNNPALAKELGQAAASFAARYLTRAYALDYWRDLLMRVSQ